MVCDTCSAITGQPRSILKLKSNAGHALSPWYQFHLDHDGTTWTTRSILVAAFSGGKRGSGILISFSQSPRKAIRLQAFLFHSHSLFHAACRRKYRSRYRPRLHDKLVKRCALFSCRFHVLHLAIYATSRKR